jgi:hypothetical protein
MAGVDGRALIKLAPSDPTFLWEECPRCSFWKAKAC